MAKIKPIETVYNGYKFRSRLEARWAVFFDAAGIKYEYEPEGYEHNGWRYLPDFYLPDFDAYAEVKPDRPGAEEDILKCMNMIYWGGPIKTIIFLGNIPGESDGGHWHFPTLYYQSGDFPDEVQSGWWFFQDSWKDDDTRTVTGHISSSRYQRPFFVDDNSKLSGMFLNGTRLNPSTEAISDKFLKNKDPLDKPDIYSNVSDSTWLEFIMSGNERFYNALRKARQARFEHGERG